MTVHLDRYDGELWCGHHRTAGGHTADYRTIIEDGWGHVDFAPIAEVDCEACLEAAADFGEKAQARLYEIWNEQEIRDRFNEPGPTPEQVEREDRVRVGEGSSRYRCPDWHTWGVP